MRNGLNPLRHQPAPAQWPEVLGTVITHLPALNGYHEWRLPIVQACLESMRRAEVPILVWDNGSCETFRGWLLDEFGPEFVFLGPNIGKWNARKAILEMVDPGTIVNISDDDMLYYPGWLDAQLELLRTFPDAGQVSGWPVRSSFQLNEHTLRWAEDNAWIAQDRFIPDEWEMDYATSLGLDPYDHLTRYRHHQDVLIEYQGVKAYATGQHCQFLCYAGRIAPLAERSPMATTNEHQFDFAIDEAGLLRLTTFERTCRHMGNVPDEKLADELAEMGLWKEMA